jgi:hypothetical protein
LAEVEEEAVVVTGAATVDATGGGGGGIMGRLPLAPPLLGAEPVELGLPAEGDKVWAAGVAKKLETSIFAEGGALENCGS